MTPELMKKQMTEAEWQKVYDMSKDKNLYHNLCSSLFPTIHGKSLIVESSIYVECGCVFDVVYYLGCMY